MRIPNVLYAYFFQDPFAGGAHTLVAASANKQIRVLGYAFTAEAAVNFQLQDTAGNPLSAFAIGIVGAGEQGDSVIPIGTSAVGQGLAFNCSAGTIGLQVRYEVV